MALGILGSIVHGMAQPIGYLLLGKALNAFGDNLNDTDAMVKAIKKVSQTIMSPYSYLPYSSLITLKYSREP